jgi:GntR family transcriptional regulator
MRLIADSHVPKYAQIADIFRQRIARGLWAQGFRLRKRFDALRNTASSR